MHLAHGEGVELEGQLRRRIGIRLLLGRQLDVEPDRRPSKFRRLTIKETSMK